ncbi:hypothetical protein AWV80_23890 [Cupriavidus sp. UYMU48A]|nr:hypothetical protein AWV80_23890 [Cupriavidus sp. UYMU48A]
MRLVRQMQQNGTESVAITGRSVLDAAYEAGAGRERQTEPVIGSGTFLDRHLPGFSNGGD